MVAVTYQNGEDDADQRDSRDRRPVRDPDDGVKGDAGREDGDALVEQLAHYVSAGGKTPDYAGLEPQVQVLIHGRDAQTEVDGHEHEAHYGVGEHHAVQGLPHRGAAVEQLRRVPWNDSQLVQKHIYLGQIIIEPGQENQTFKI